MSEFSKPILKDGVEFKIGMTLVNDYGSSLVTNEEDFEVKYFGECPWICSKKGKGIYRILPGTLYSSQEARENEHIKMLQELKSIIDEDIYLIRTEGKVKARFSRSTNYCLQDLLDVVLILRRV